MCRMLPAMMFLVALLASRSLTAQIYGDTPAPAGIEAQPLAPPHLDTQPTALMPPAERSPDQSTGDGAPSAKPLRPTPHTDADIEDRITATVIAPANTPAQAPRRSVEPPTQIISGGMSHPSSVAPAQSRWEGPQERALDQALPGTNLVAPQGAPDVEEDEVRRLNGGSLNQ